MRRPSDTQERERLEEAFKGLKNNVHFDVFVEWLREQLRLRDTENRTIGSENQTSEAHALAVILSQYEDAVAPKT